MNRYLRLVHFLETSPHRTVEELFSWHSARFQENKSVNFVSVGISSSYGICKARLTREFYQTVYQQWP